MFRDSRDYQILALLLFLTLGITTRDWNLQLGVVGMAIATCLTVQWLATAYLPSIQQTSTNQANPLDPPVPTPFNPSLRSALITALSLSLLLRVDHVWTMAIAAAGAILSKFVFRLQGKHYFNPANFGIITTLVLTQDAWVSPGQWGEVSWLGFLFIALAGVVLQRVGRWDTSVAFLGMYASLMGLRSLWLGWTWDVWMHSLMNGSLWLFALFMITDPRSIPDARIGRLIWSSCLAGLTFILQTQFFMPTAPFWVLFGFAPFSLLLDRIWTHPRFKWT